MLVRTVRKAWPWLVLASVLGVAVAHVLVFFEAAETEFPKVVRPYFNPLPPAAYRLAEPGDTLDRIGLYFACAAMVVSAAAIFVRRKGDLALWPSALTLAMAATWHASTPGPTFDGWHGLGWRVILDSNSPTSLRWTLGVSALALIAVVVANLIRKWPIPVNRRIIGLLVVAAILVACRQIDLKGVQPVGYWPRVAFDLGVLAFLMALIRSQPLVGVEMRRRAAIGMVGGWVTLVVLGVSVTIYHRPLARLHAVVPGRIYISAMPSYRGLKIAQDRHHFKTIINLFPEDTAQAQLAYHPQELAIHQRDAASAI